MTPSHQQPLGGIFSLRSLLLLCSLLPAASWAAADSDKPLDPCTIRSPSTHAFFDLNKIAKHPPTEKDYKKHENDPDWEVTSYHVKGHDYGANFTINFCAPVVEHVKDVEGVHEDLWKNVSAFYEMGGRTYSIGQQSSEPLFRGRKLVLNYTDGSPCPGSSQAFAKRGAAPVRPSRSMRRSSKRRDYDTLHSHQADDLELAKQKRPGYSLQAAEDGADDDDDGPWPEPTGPGDDSSGDNSTSHDGIRRKTTILSLLCEKDPLAPRAAVSFVAAVDQCSYFFEVRTSAACAGVEAHTSSGSIGPGGVFGVIAVIAVLVYMVGGCVYQRTVMNQRGWRQLPNYSMWHSCFSAFTDCFVILTSSCARWLPASSRGYSRVSGVPSGGYGRGRNGHADAENRLIDQLDEEWDD